MTNLFCIVRVKGGNEMGWNVFGKDETCRIVSQKDIDIIRAEAEAITSTGDKVGLINELYKLIEPVETALKWLDIPEKAMNVKQTREELLQLQKSLAETREYIMSSRVPQQKYGLYVKYPKGYEG